MRDWINSPNSPNKIMLRYGRRNSASNRRSTAGVGMGTGSGVEFIPWAAKSESEGLQASYQYHNNAPLAARGIARSTAPACRRAPSLWLVRCDANKSAGSVIGEPRDPFWNSRRQVLATAITSMQSTISHARSTIALPGMRASFRPIPIPTSLNGKKTLALDSRTRQCVTNPSLRRGKIYFFGKFFLLTRFGFMEKNRVEFGW